MTSGAPFQYLPFSIPQIVGAETPNMAPIFAADAVPLSPRIVSTSKGDSFRLLPACAQGVSAIDRTPRTPPRVQDFPVVTEVMVETPTPVISEISALDLSPATRSSFTAFICSTVNLDCFGAFSAQNRPALAECSIFSAGLTHSRLLTELFVLLKSLWFISLLPAGNGPINARATSLCTKFADCLLTPCASGRVCRTIRRYPFGSSTGFRNLVLSSLPLAPQPPRTKILSLLTLPKSLTSYSPSYPTTAFQFSSSIFNLISGICSHFFGLISRVISGPLRTAQLLFLSALRELHPVYRPMPALQQALGLVYRS